MKKILISLFVFSFVFIGFKVQATDGYVDYLSLTVLSPNGGETIQVGQKYNITWESFGIANSNNLWLSLKNEAIKCNTSIIDGLEATNPGCQTEFVIDPVLNTGSYLWDTNQKMFGSSTGPDSIPVTPGTKYKIKVCHANTCDYSNNSFSIISQPEENVCCESFGYGAYMVKTPSTYKIMPRSQCSVCTPDPVTGIDRCITGGGRNIVSMNYCELTPLPTPTPTISKISGPQILEVNQMGTWKIVAYDSGGGTLSYSVKWGDLNNDCSSGASCTVAQDYQQTATFTHNYSKAGTYHPTFTVENTLGKVASTSLSVTVGPSLTKICPVGCTCTGELVACPVDPAPDVCLSGHIYNLMTGELCPQVTEDGCLPGYKYDPTTGELCKVQPEEDLIRRITKTLRLGIKGEEVQFLQSFLGIITDGIFGPATELRVKEWQTSNNLMSDGIFGNMSRQKARWGTQ